VKRAVLLALLLVPACGRHADNRSILGVAGRTNANATLASEGMRVAVVWAASGSTGADIELALSADGGKTFAPPVRVNDVSGEATVSGEQPPRVVLHGAAVDVVWVAKQDRVPAIRAATSKDGGLTFSPARTITPAGISGARGWESAAVADDGSLHVAWLDGRAANAPTPSAGFVPTSAMPPGHHHHMAAPRQDIFHAMWTGADPPSETRVAANVCFCCKTALVTQGADVYVAWRHLFDGGVRDVAVAHSPDEGRTFGDPVRASADNWKIDACPDDGPAMAVDRSGALHIVWPTLLHEEGRDRMAVFHAVSTDRGRTFTPRERVDEMSGVGASHPRIAAGPDGSVAVVWDEMVKGGRRIAARVFGARAAGVEVLSGSEASSYPSVAATPSGYVVTWTQQDPSGSRVVVRSRS
jgi:hypothetical protein